MNLTSHFRFLILFLCLFFLSGCQRVAKLSVSQSDQGVLFHFVMKNINGLLRLNVKDPKEKRIYWDVNLNYFKEATLNYGEIPTQFKTFNDNVNSAKQIFPIDNKPPASLPTGIPLEACIEYQYDEFLAPSIGIKCTTFVLR